MKLLIDEDTLNIVLDALNIGYLIASDPEDIRRFACLRERLLQEMSEAKNARPQEEENRTKKSYT